MKTISHVIQCLVIITYLYFLVKEFSNLNIDNGEK